MQRMLMKIAHHKDMVRAKPIAQFPDEHGMSPDVSQHQIAGYPTPEAIRLLAIPACALPAAPHRHCLLPPLPLGTAVIPLRYQTETNRCKEPCRGEEWLGSFHSCGAEL